MLTEILQAHISAPWASLTRLRQLLSHPTSRVLVYQPSFGTKSPTSSTKLTLLFLMTCFATLLSVNTAPLPTLAHLTPQPCGNTLSRSNLMDRTTTLTFHLQPLPLITPMVSVISTFNTLTPSRIANPAKSFLDLCSSNSTSTDGTTTTQLEHLTTTPNYLHLARSLVLTSDLFALLMDLAPLLVLSEQLNRST